MKNRYKKISLIVVIIIIVTAIQSSQVISIKMNNKNFYNIDLVDNNIEILLLRVEHYLYLKALDNTDIFEVNYAFPPNYQYQVPIFLEIYEDSTADILNYNIDDDDDKLNKIVRFTIRSMEKEEIVLIHFSCWVLVKNHNYDDLPDYVKIPEKKELPEETKLWLSSTDSVQSKNILIKFKAMQLRGHGNNLMDFADNISSFIKEHRYFLFLIQLNLGIFFSQDAITTLFINGENVGRSHLACALLRSNNIPARVLLVNNDQGFWTQMHYMIEYYCPNYGWVLIDSTKGETPYETKRQVVNRVCFPEDEENTKTDYIIPFMKNEERWIWIDNEKVFPYYVDCNEGSKSQMFCESKIKIDTFSANYAFFKTQMVFIKYSKHLGNNLTEEDHLHLQNAISYQKKAINELQKNNDIFEYIFFIDKAYDEYKKIESE